jgi:hypothetical protein
MKKIFKIPALLFALILIISCFGNETKSDDNTDSDDELSSSSDNSKIKSKKITFNQAEAFMEERCKKINQTLMKKKSVSFDGTEIYMFLSVAENGYVCISSISENVLDILAVDCGTSDRKIREWNELN